MTVNVTKSFRLSFILALLATSLTLPRGAFAQIVAPALAQPDSNGIVVTRHQITIGGRVVHYTARAGFLPLENQSGETMAKIFFVAYVLDNPGNKVRPVTFAWNGGPGSSSSLLHLGALGPKRVKSPKEYAKAPPPYQLVENESTWLGETDLVVVDPVGTGYSYPATPELEKMFWNDRGDIDSISEFVRVYLTHYDLLNAPLFVAGESYGTLRAAGVAETLGRRGIHVDGVILLSTVLGVTDNVDLEDLLIIPNYTAAAFAHNKLPADLEVSLRASTHQAAAWAESQYASALLKGDELNSAERQQVLVQMARYTGLDTAFLSRSNLRVGMGAFAQQLLSKEHRFVGHYDTRATASAASHQGQYDPTEDPSLFGDGTGDLIVPYLRSELGFKSDAVYQGPFGGAWPSPTTPRGDWMSVMWTHGKGFDVDGTTALKNALTANRDLRVFVGSGYYDLSTPWLGTEYAISHMGLDPELRSHVTINVYPAGHAIYIDPDARAQLCHDVAAFIQTTLDLHHGSWAVTGPTN